MNGKEMVQAFAGQFDCPDIVSAVNAMEVVMLKCKQADCPLIHHFGPGLYIREVNMPAGTFAIGHRQKTRHLNIFIKGRVTMLNDDGTVKELVAPMIFTSDPGRKMGYVSEDVVWLNVYPTNEKDIDTLESMFIEESDTWKKSQKVGLPKVIDNEDYKRVLKEFGYDEVTARMQSENEDDQVPFPDGSYSVEVFPSAIEGLGLFASAGFKVGEVIAPAKIHDKRTPAGRYCNHSKHPNAKMVRIGPDVFLVAVKAIKGRAGGMPGDEITTNYRVTLQL